MTHLTQANAQWASRPADQRFTNLLDLQAVTHRSRENSVGGVVSSRRLRAMPISPENPNGLLIEHPTFGTTEPTHWAFGQIAQLAGAPAGYLRKLPAPLAADAINFGLRFLRDAEDVGYLRHQDGQAAPEIRAVTGPRYGRIWNSDIVDALVDRFGDGVSGDFRVPGEFGKRVPVTNENTTIYGSDRDIFVFLADETNRIEVADRRNGQAGSLARGFFVWNSEVGSQSIGVAFFLFDYVCRNRIVWGARDVKEIRLRHTVSAPDRWLEEVAPVLNEYSASSAKPIEEAIRAAQTAKIEQDMTSFLSSRFSKGQAAAMMRVHEEEEGRPIETIWDAVTATTAYARNIQHQDSRVEIERTAGKILDLVAA